MIRKNFNTVTNILEITPSGDVTLDEIIAMQLEIKNDKSLPRDLKILNDSTGANVSISLNGINQMMNTFSEVLQNYNSVRSALVTDNPQLTAFNTIYKLDMNYVANYLFEVFSTKEAAIEFLLS